MRALVGRTAWPSRVALAAGVGFVLLGLLVATGGTHALDVATTARLRPGDAWGAAQVSASPWMARLSPPHMGLVLAAATATACAWRRTWRPALFAVVLTGSATVLTTAVKLTLQRPDPHGWVAPTGGAFPSGHVVAVVVCCAGSVMVLSSRVRWWQWAPVLAAGALMARALLVSAAHWPSDVLGGFLLAVAVVALVSPLGPAPEARASRRNYLLREEVDEHRSARSG
jgi:membrane-associated phospholipid phosphatase